MIDTARKLLGSSQNKAEKEYIESCLHQYESSLKLSLADMKNLAPTAVGKKIIAELGEIAL